MANRHNKVKVIALIRGGGAKEDLECFNSEKLAIEIHNSKIPIVTGIGHQIDKTIADMVSAQSFITPTAVAQNITNSSILSYSTCDQQINAIQNKINSSLNKIANYINSFSQQSNDCISAYINDLNYTINIFDKFINQIKIKIYNYVQDMYHGIIAYDDIILSIPKILVPI